MISDGTGSSGTLKSEWARALLPRSAGHSPPPDALAWHRLAADDVLSQLGSSAAGSPRRKRPDAVMQDPPRPEARAAADMIVSDDNLALIVAAVEEGRGIHDNIRKTLRHPRHRSERITNRRSLGSMLLTGGLTAGVSFAVYFLGRHSRDEGQHRNVIDYM